MPKASENNPKGRRAPQAKEATMAAQPARFLIRFSPAPEGPMGPHVAEWAPLGTTAGTRVADINTEVSFGLDSLPMGELRGIAKAACIGEQPYKPTKENLRDWIEQHTNPAGFERSPEFTLKYDVGQPKRKRSPLPAPAPEPAPQGPQDDAEPLPYPEPAPAPQPAPQGPAGHLTPEQLEALGSIFAPPPPVDIEALRTELVEVAREASDAAVREHIRPVIRVEHRDAPDIELTGHTHEALPTVIALARDAQRLNTPRCGVALVGPAGTGKSTMAAQCAEALGLEVTKTACSPDMGTHEIKGYVNPGTGQPVETAALEAWRDGKMWLVDEFDKSHPGIAAVTNALVDNSPTFTFGTGEIIARHAAYFAAATMNTWGTGPDAAYVGSNKLDAATLDRFHIVYVDYDKTLELDLAEAVGGREGLRWATKIHALRDVAQASRQQVLIGQRAVVSGAALLADGMDEELVMETQVTRGMTHQQREALGI